MRFYCALLFSSISVLFGALFASQAPQLHVIAYSFGKNEGLEYFAQSAQSKNVRVELLKSSKRIIYGQKILDLKRYLKTLPLDDVVMVVEPKYALLVETSDQILEKFKRFKAPFVIAAQIFCPLVYDDAFDFPPSPFGFRYPYSGAYIGYVRAVMDKLNAICPKVPMADEQELIFLDYVKDPSKYHLDYSCELFMPLAGVNKSSFIFDYENQKVESTITGSLPSVILGEGSGRYTYEWIYESLWDASETDKRDAI